jgi:two-component system, LytTR family, response regulator
MNSSIRTLIVDDEPPARERIRELLQQDSEIDVIGECSEGKKTQRFLEKHRVDLLFLDIQIPELSGIDLLRGIDASLLPEVIFVTAYDQYAIEAFTLHALDYLLKPFDDERFFDALQHAKSRLKDSRQTDLQSRLIAMLNDYEGRIARIGVSRTSTAIPATTTGHYIPRLMVKAGGRTSLVNVNDINWVEAADNYVLLHLAAGKSIPMREKIRTLASKLDPKRFFQIHRSIIVNLDSVLEIQPYTRGDYVVIVRNGARLKLSRLRYEKLKRALGTAA